MVPATQIRLIVSDIDGVWTDGRIIYVSDGNEIKEFNVRDGLAVKLAQRAGIAVAVLTSRRSPSLERRARELGILHIRQGAANKLTELESLASIIETPLDQILYVGDDLPDLGPMLSVALSAAPADAAPEVLAAATWKLEAAGGRGAFREVVERLLRERGEWDTIIKEFGSGKPQAASI